MLRMIGKIVPALRAVLDGVNGASARSDKRDGIAEAERAAAEMPDQDERNPPSEPRLLVAHRDHERREDQPDRRVRKPGERPLQRFGWRAKRGIGELPRAEGQSEHRDRGHANQRRWPEPAAAR